jgi:hypothetical protein
MPKPALRGPIPASVRDDAIKSECYPRILGLLDADEYQKLALSVIGVKRMLGSLLAKIDTDRRKAEC